MRRIDAAEDAAGALRAILAKVSLLADFSPADLDMLQESGAAHLYRFEAGETLVEEGNYEKTFFVLLRGAVRVVRGGRLVTELDAPGTVFGEMSLILGKGRTATVVAASVCDCLAVDMGYVDFLPGPEREDFLIRIFRRLAGIVEARLGSANARKAELLQAIRDRRQALRAVIETERQAINALRRELASLDTADDEAVLRQLLDRRF
jgi:CRP-like cAMP-binding protein